MDSRPAVERIHPVLAFKGPTKFHRDIVPCGTPFKGGDVVPAGSWAVRIRQANEDLVQTGSSLQDVVQTSSWPV
jgi:hypothetical protein